MENSKKWQLNWEDAKQIGIKFLMLIVAAVLPELIKELDLIDFGPYQGAATVTIFMLSYAGQRLGKGK